MCDVPSTVVFCGESIECFYSIASKFFLKPFVIILVAPSTVEAAYYDHFGTRTF
jgi:hypothetical protein